MPSAGPRRDRSIGRPYAEGGGTIKKDGTAGTPAVAARPTAPSAAISDLLDQVFTAVGVGLCLLDPDGLVVRANAEWSRTVGLANDQAPGRSIWDLVQSSTPELRRLHDEVRTGKTVEVPAHRQLRDGHER